MEKWAELKSDAAKRGNDPKNRIQDDVNYDHLTMEMSDDSQDSNNGKSIESNGSNHKEYDDVKYKSRSPENKRKSRSKTPEYRKHKRKDRSRDRSRERDKRRHRDTRSRSPPHYRHSRRSRSRSRSRSRDRSHRGGRDSHYSSRHRSRSRSPRRPDKSDPKVKMNTLQKLGIKLPDPAETVTVPGLPSYYNPNAINAQRYAEQIAKRKLIWSNKTKPVETAQVVPPKTSNIWQGAKFSQDEDGKLTAKFQRLMGIKNNASPSGTGQSSSGKQDLNKKQEELFSSMELQYDAARAATHTQRGVGLGFATQPTFPR